MLLKDVKTGRQGLTVQHYNVNMERLRKRYNLRSNYKFVYFSMDKISNKSRLPYLTGFFDGEGCIAIIKGKNRLGNTQYGLRVIVSNTNEYVLQLFKFTFGGRIYKKKHLESIKWRDCYAWTLNALNAYEFLKSIYPYLIIKKAEADLAFEFQENQSDYVHGSARLNKKVLDLREKQRILMQELKRR